MRHIQNEVLEREWELFDECDTEVTGDRTKWRKAWLNWREQHLKHVLAGRAYLRVWIESTCIGCFDCEIMCPEVFSVGKHKSQVRKDCTVKDEQNGPHLLPDLLETCYDNLELARQACPVDAISICISDPDHPEPLPKDFA